MIAIFVFLLYPYKIVGSILQSQAEIPQLCEVTQGRELILYEQIKFA